MTRATIGLAAVAVISPTTAAFPQNSNPSPPQARDLVLAVESRFVIEEDSIEASRSESGAAILVGIDDGRIYLATAKHVIAQGSIAREVTVRRYDSQEPIAATVADTVPDLDLAVLTIPRAAIEPLPALDRRGDPRRLRYNDLVSPMGCPRGVCWAVPAPPDRVVGIDRQGIIFQSVFVNPGSSGGALFNGDWEVVGLVTYDQPPRANAISIDDVLDHVLALQHPVSLRRSKVPRTGYSLHAGASLLAAINPTSESSLPDSRALSGRIVATRRGDLYGLTWHIAALRLAPPNLRVTAATGGVGVDFRWGWVTVQPFLELGLGRVEGRYFADTVAYTVGGKPVPYIHAAKEDGPGIGGGMSVMGIVAPHITLEVIGGHWSFKRPTKVPEPDKVPELPDVFIGGGVRWGI
jgi:S1-C subfamily serine protease